MSLSDTILERKRKTENLFCAAVYLNPDSARHDVSWLLPETFNDNALSDFWRAVREGANVAEAAMNTNTWDRIIQSVPDIVGSFEYEAFARTIAEDAYYLGLSEQLPELAKAISKRDGQTIHKAIDKISSGRPLMDEGIPDALDTAMEFDAWLQSEERAINTRITSLDEAMGGLDRQTLTLIAARPSVGKTALGFQIARNFARSGYKTIMFSLEMSRRQLWSRAACGQLGFDIRAVRAKRLNEDQMDDLRRKSLELASLYGDRLLIDDSTGQTSETIWAKVARYRPDAIIVDHTSLVGDRDISEVRRIGQISWLGKRIAKEFNLVAIYLQQLNRGTETRDEKQPRLSDLRDSGELEQNADNVIFIYREDYYKPTQPGVDVLPTELIISKFRDGVRNISVRLDFHARRQWFARVGEHLQSEDVW